MLGLLKKTFKLRKQFETAIGELQHAGKHLSTGPRILNVQRIILITVALFKSQYSIFLWTQSKTISNVLNLQHKKTIPNPTDQNWPWFSLSLKSIWTTLAVFVHVSTLLNTALTLKIISCWTSWKWLQRKQSKTGLHQKTATKNESRDWSTKLNFVVTSALKV